MPDYFESKKFYDARGIPYDDNQGNMWIRKYNTWISIVTDGQGNFHQNMTTPQIKYPRKNVIQMFRVKPVDDPENKEYLTTVEEWIGVNAFGVEQKLTADKLQVFPKPLFRVGRKTDTNNPNRIEQSITGVDRTQDVYTVVFNKKNADEAYARANPHKVSLAVKEAGTGQAPKGVATYEDFVNKPFYDLLYGKKTTADEKDKPGNPPSKS